MADGRQWRIWPFEGESETIEPVTGTIYCGDNLDVLYEYTDRIPHESIDLVYLDPPFNSKQTYNLIYKGSQAQEVAFKDYWSWEEAAPEYARLRGSPEIPAALRALLMALHDGLANDDSDQLAYLVMMAPRLAALHRKLKPTGALYLHCDPTASHYLKLMLDTIFGPGRFRNEIVWKRTVPKSDFRQGAANWPRVHDVLLYYAKSDASPYHQALGALSPGYIESHYSQRDPDGRRYQLTSLNAPGAGSRGHPKYEFMGVTRYWRYGPEKMRALQEQGRIVQPSPGAVPRYKRYLDEAAGVPVGDIWDDIAPINSQAQERLGYPTQKPLALLTRVIEASSNPGDIVLDPFCGCGTTIEAAERLGRRWIGIDLAKKAVDLLKQRFATAELPDPDVVWHPADMDAARALAEDDKRAFEAWCLRKLGARRIGR